MLLLVSPHRVRAARGDGRWTHFPQALTKMPENETRRNVCGDKIITPTIRHVNSHLLTFRQVKEGFSEPDDLFHEVFIDPGIFDVEKSNPEQSSS